MSYTMPPGPPAPKIVQSALFAKRPLTFLEKCRRRYGEVFTLRLMGLGSVVYVANRDAIRQVFTGDNGVFHAGEAYAMLEPLVGSQSLVILDDEAHLRLRRLLLPLFHGDSVARFRDVIEAATRAEVDRWPVGRPFRLQPSMQALTLGVISRMLFGLSEEHEVRALTRLLQRLFGGSTSLVVWIPWMRRDLGPGSPWRRFTHLRDELDAFVLAAIEDHRRDPELSSRLDLLSTLMSTVEQQGVGLSDAEIRDQVVTLLLAGHETTTTALTWAVERLLRNPVALARLRAELDADGDAYLSAVVIETLRARPAVMECARRLTSAATVDGYVLPAGTVVMPGIALVHGSEQGYDAPTEFRPERFLNWQPDSYAWIPFGGGVRRCLGAPLAQFEMKVVLGTLFNHASLRVARKRPEKIGSRQHLAVLPSPPIRVVMEERRA